MYTNTIGKTISSLWYSFKHRNDPIPLPEEFKYVCCSDVRSMYPLIMTAKGIEECVNIPAYETNNKQDKEQMLKDWEE